MDDNTLPPASDSGRYVDAVSVRFVDNEPQIIGGYEPTLKMNAERVSFLAHEAVSVFETLDDEDAIIVALGNLVAILKDVAREPATVISAERIKAAVCDKLIARCRSRADFLEVEASPV